MHANNSALFSECLFIFGTVKSNKKKTVSGFKKTGRNLLNTYNFGLFFFSIYNFVDLLFAVIKALIFTYITFSDHRLSSDQRGEQIIFWHLIMNHTVNVLKYKFV